MKRSSIYIRNQLSERELELLKKDLIDHCVEVASKIKHLGLATTQITIIALNAVERVLFTYKFGKGGSLGEIAKMQVMHDLRLEHTKAFPALATKIVWPDLVEKKPFDRLVSMLESIKTLKKSVITEILDITNEVLNGRQQKLLKSVYLNPAVTYGEICKQFGTRGVMTYREIKIIHSHLLKTIQYLEINL